MQKMLNNYKLYYLNCYQAVMKVLSRALLLIMGFAVSTKVVHGGYGVMTVLLCVDK
jgi:hypothetical protein